MKIQPISWMFLLSGMLLIGCAGGTGGEGAATIGPTAAAPTPEAVTTGTPSPVPTAAEPVSTRPPLFSEGTIWDFGARGYGYVYEANVCWRAGAAPVFLGAADEWVGMIEPSPDGSLIAYAKVVPTNSYTDEELWIVGTDGSSPTLALTTADLRAHAPDAAANFYGFVWMPDSAASLLFSSIVDVAGWPMVRTNPDLYRYDLATDQITTLMEASPGVPAATFTVSPDGQWIAFAEFDVYRTVSLLRTDGSARRDQAFRAEMPAETSMMVNPVWAADSSGVTFFVTPNVSDLEITAGDMSIWYLPVEGEPQMLGHFVDTANTFNGAYLIGGEVAPDHQHFAYAMPYPNYTLVVAKVDGTGAMTLFDEASDRDARNITAHWLDSSTLQLDIEPDEMGARRFLIALDGTVMPVELPSLPERALISCAPLR